MGKKDKRYALIGGKKRALSRWYMIRYRVQHTERPKNKRYKGVEFNLDKEEFIRWFQKNDFEHASVDRIDKNKGYTMDNIQLIPLIENIRKDKVKCKNGRCVCYVCGEEKEIELFVKESRRVNGYSTICKSCEVKRTRLRRKDATKHTELLPGLN